MVRSTTAAFAAVLAASCLHLAAATPALILNQIYPLVMEQLDPIISPNAMSSHMHSVFGGSGFGAAYNYADSQAASCSSTYMSVDKSNYWAPLYVVVCRHLPAPLLTALSPSLSQPLLVARPVRIEPSLLPGPERSPRLLLSRPPGHRARLALPARTSHDRRQPVQQDAVVVHPA